MVRLFFKSVMFSIIQISFGTLPKNVLLNDGHEMPPIAFGTFGKILTLYLYCRKGLFEQFIMRQRESLRSKFKEIGIMTLTEVEEIAPVVSYAIEVGFRHIDTAPSYYNEEEIGEAIINVTSRGIVTREELFITTKLDVLHNSSLVVPALRRSLERLKLDYVDLYVIHMSHSAVTGEELNYMDIWRGMEDAKRLGLTRSIGLSNFNSTHINKILANFTIRPAVNQIEVNPTYTRLDLIAYCQSQGIYVTSFGPHGFLVPRPFRDVSPPPHLNDTMLEKIAKKYRKNTSQVVLRYLVDRDIIPIPRSKNRTHIMSNINIFDFSLQPSEVYAINEFNSDTKVYLNEGGRRMTESFYEYYYGTTVDNIFLY